MGQTLPERDITSDKAGGQIPINKPKVGGGWKTYRINVTDLLAGTGSQPIQRLNKTGNDSQAIASNSFVNQISILPVSGTPTIKIGTSPNGNQIADTFAIGNFAPVTVQLYFPDAGTIYFVITDGSVNIRIDVFNNYI